MACKRTLRPRPNRAKMNMLKGLSVDTSGKTGSLEARSRKDEKIRKDAKNLANNKAMAGILGDLATDADDMSTPNNKKKKEGGARAMTPHELERIKTAQAYEIFSLLDVDGSGRVSRREMERFLAGDTRHTFRRWFDDNDVGIFWGKTDFGVCLDRSHCA